MASCEDCGLPIAAGQQTCLGCEALHLAHNRVQQRAWSSATWRACGQALQAVVHMAEVAAGADPAVPAAPLPAGRDARAERSRSLDSYSPAPWPRVARQREGGGQAPRSSTIAATRRSHRTGEAAEAEVDAEDLVMREAWEAKATIMQGAKATARQSSWPGPAWDWAVSTGRFYFGC